MLYSCTWQCQAQPGCPALAPTLADWLADRPIDWLPACRFHSTYLGSRALVGTLLDRGEPRSEGALACRP